MKSHKLQQTLEKNPYNDKEKGPPNTTILVKNLEKTDDLAEVSKSVIKKIIEIYTTNTAFIKEKVLSPSDLTSLRTVYEHMSKLVNKETLKEILIKEKRIEPIPSDFWKIDRNIEEYSDKTGFDMDKYIQNLEHRPIVLDLGPGIGTEKRFKEYLEQATIFGYGDTLYFNLDNFVHNLINEVSENYNNKQNLEKLKVITLICNFILSDNTLYNRICENPSEILQILQDAPYLFYDHQDILNDLKKINTDSIKSNYTKHIDAQPNGMIYGDFLDIDSLPSNCFDLISAVRSTVYLKASEYSHFYNKAIPTLTSTGIFIDDSIRENFGRSYRIETYEELAMKKEKNSFIFVIIGPTKNKEEESHEIIPLSMITVKKSLNIIDKDDAREYLTPFLMDSCSIIDESQISALQIYK